MKKIVILLLIVVAVAAGVFYFFRGEAVTDVQTDALKSFASWKAYDGKSTMGFTLKHPADWIVDDSSQDFVSFMPVDESGFNSYRVKASNKKQSLTQWLKANDKANSEAMGGQYDDRVISTKKIKVAKLSAVKRVEYADAAGFYFIQTYVKKGNYFYVFALQVGPSGSYNSKDEKIYNKILSTVQFAK